MSYALYSIRDVNMADMEQFTCGVTSMDAYLYHAALQYDLANEAKTWLFADLTLKQVAGYYTLKCALVDVIDSHFRREHVPAVEISRIAVSSALQGTGSGKGFLGYHERSRKPLALAMGMKATSSYFFKRLYYAKNRGIILIWKQNTRQTKIRQYVENQKTSQRK